MAIGDALSAWERELAANINGLALLVEKVLGLDPFGKHGLKALLPGAVRMSRIA